MACFFIATSATPDAAINVHFGAIARELMARGHRVVMLRSSVTLDVSQPDAVPPVYIWPSPRPTRLRDALFLYSLVRQYRPDCLVGNFAATNLMLIVGWLTGVRSRIAWFHTVREAARQDATQPTWWQRLLVLRKRLVLRLATAVVAVSHEARADAIRSYGISPERCHVCYKSLADPVPPDRQPLPLSDRRGIVCVGTISPNKGQDLLIQAAARLTPDLPELEIQLIGWRRDEEPCRRLAQELGLEDRCTFTGVLEHPEVLRRVEASLVAVIPSRSEAFGYAAVEALALGTPVIASRTGGLLEIVRDEVDGFLVPVGDVEALADRIRQALLDPDLWQRLQENARQGFLDRFEQGQVVPGIVDWLEAGVT